MNFGLNLISACVAGDGADCSRVARRAARSCASASRRRRSSCSSSGFRRRTLTLPAADRRPLLHARRRRRSERPPSSRLARISRATTERSRGGRRARCSTSRWRPMPRNLGGMRIPANVQRLRHIRSRSGIFTRPRTRRSAAASRRAIAYGSEGGGLTTLLEAMSMGKPVVATRRAILRTTSTTASTGFSFRRRIRRRCEPRSSACSATTAAARLGEAGRARVERAHTTRGFAAQLAPVLRDVVYPRSS